MNPNPYDPPQSDLRQPAQSAPEESQDRASALRRVRTSLLILLPPALYNIGCFHFPPDPRPGQRPLPLELLIVNSVGFLLVVLFVWYFGLVALEFIAAGAQGVMAKRSTQDQWKQALYTSLHPAPVLSFLGAPLWVAWVVGIFDFHANFLALSIPIGIASHALAALLYVPLFWRWYKLERDQLPSETV